MSDTNYSYDSINFHKTFPPQDSYVTKIIELAQAGFAGTKEEISMETGIPTGKTSGKVVPHILYSQYMGLTTYALDKGKYTLGLTDLGKVVWDNDKYLFEDVTRLLCHYNMCDNENGAYLWSFIYNGLPLMLGENMSDETLKRKYNNSFQVKSDLGALKKAYKEDGFFAQLDLLDFTNGICINSSYFKETRLFAYAYALFKSWESRYSGIQEITSDQIMEMKWDKRLGFDNDEMLFSLERFEEKNLIRLNKQLIPYTVVANAKAIDILSHIYGLLN